MPNDTVRLSFKNPKTGKSQRIQTHISKHDNDREKALEFLKQRKAKILEPEQQDEPQEEPKEEPIEQPKQSETETTNLIDIPTESNKQIDEIIKNLKYSPVKLQMNLKETGISLVVYGSSKSYKTTFIKRIIKQYFGKDVITLLCATNIHAPIYNDLPSDVIKIDNYCPELVTKMHQINKKSKNKYSFVVILDDVIDQRSEQNLQKLFCTLRNAKISVVILLQHVTMLGSSCRGNANIVVFRKFNQPSVIENHVMKQYLAGYPPFSLLNNMQDKVNLYMKITNKHDFFILDVLNNTLTIHKEPEV